MKKINLKYGFVLIATALIMTSCGGDKGQNSSTTETSTTNELATESETSEFGVGPIQHQVSFDGIDADLAANGEQVFTQKCMACHKMDKRHVGPALVGVLDRRNPSWVMNMILNPDKMVQQDPTAKALLAEYLSPMANQNLTEEQARAVLEYFRKYDADNQ
ncbi:MAG: cytochrome c [Flavobacteriales bacterium]|nr:cytochrome c [Bacteroidota bacterium]MCB9241306.1 cytochrome c [Flavobacteriales bacterium]